MKVLGFGDNIIDRFIDRRVFYPGGNCVNFAVFARQLGAESAYLGVFGSDSYADFLREAISAEGVSLSHCVTRSGESGLTDLIVDDGERVFGDWNGGGVTMAEPLVLDDELLAYIARFDLVHSSVFSRSETELPLLRRLGTLVSFDLSSEDEYRDPDYLDRVCPYADLVLVSASELSAADTQRLLVDVVARGAGIALATRGTEGSMAWNGRDLVSGSSVLVKPEEIVDTMGCGDAFVTAFALRLLRSGWSRTLIPRAEHLSAGLAAGSAFAAEQCRADGAFGHGSGYAAEQGDTIFTRDGYRTTNYR